LFWSIVKVRQYAEGCKNVKFNSPFVFLILISATLVWSSLPLLFAAPSLRCHEANNVKAFLVVLNKADLIGIGIAPVDFKSSYVWPSWQPLEKQRALRNSSFFDGVPFPNKLAIF
jgi:hypothetical protein